MLKKEEPDMNKDKTNKLNDEAPSQSMSCNNSESGDVPVSDSQDEKQQQTVDSNHLLPPHEADQASNMELKVLSKADKELLLKDSRQEQAKLIREWNVVYTSPRAEKRVYDRLLELGIKSYLPMYKTIRQWSDRKKKVEVPLFNSYVFVHVNEKERLSILGIHGVVKFVYYLRKPARVRQKEINAIKRFLRQSEGMRIKVKMGDVVEIANGAMEGRFGEVIRITKTKLMLRIEQLNMSLVVEVDRSIVKWPYRTYKNKD